MKESTEPTDLEKQGKRYYPFHHFFQLRFIFSYDNQQQQDERDLGKRSPKKWKKERSQRIRMCRTGRTSGLPRSTSEHMTY